MDMVGLTIRGSSGKVITSDECSMYTPCSGVTGRWFLFKRNGQAGAIINVINAIESDDKKKSSSSLKGATISLNTKLFGPVKQAMAWPLNGKPFVIHGKQEGNIYTFPIPETELSSVVLSKSLRPVVEWMLDPVATAGGNKIVSLKITNVNAVPLSGTVTLRLPEGWNKVESTAFGPIASGATVELAIPFNIPDRRSVRGRFDVWCDIKSDAGSFSAYNLLVVNDAVLTDFRGMPGNYYIWLKNLTKKEYDGTLKVNAPAPLTVSALDSFTLSPLAEINLPITVDGQERLREISEMMASISVAGLKLERVHAAIPAIPNGDFETDSAGDMKPDWWMCRTKNAKYSYDKIHLSTDAHSGRYSLLLYPSGKNDYTSAYPLNSVLKPNTKYRASAWIKAEATDSIYIQLPGKKLGKGQTGPEWRRFEHEFTTGAKPWTCLRLEQAIINGSSEPALFDDIAVEEIRCMETIGDHDK